MCESIHDKFKLKEMCNVYDIKARNVFVKLKVTTVMIKCAHRVNLHGVRISMINNNECGNECP